MLVFFVVANLSFVCVLLIGAGKKMGFSHISAEEAQRSALLFHLKSFKY